MLSASQLEYRAGAGVAGLNAGAAPGPRTSESALWITGCHKMYFRCILTPWLDMANVLHDPGPVPAGSAGPGRRIGVVAAEVKS